MPKLKNVTAAEFKALKDKSEDVLFTMHDLHDRIEKGYCDDLPGLAEGARHFTAIARAASSLAMDLLVKVNLQEQRAEIERALRARAGKDGE